MQYNKNDNVTIHIDDIGNDGEGIGKADGYTLFIKDAIIGDTVEAKITKAKKNYAYARLEQVIEPSVFRVTPECKFHRQCGGCQIQAMSYEKQLAYKADKVKNNLVRIGGFDAGLIDSITEPIIGMEEPYHYRNKAQYPVGTDKNGAPITGFYAGRTHTIIPNTNCLIGAKENKEILEAVLEFMDEFRISAYDETTGRGIIRHILIRTGFTTGEIMLCVIINAAKFPHAERFVEELSGIPNIKSISFSINRENTNVIMGETVVPLWGDEYITDYIGDIKFRISAQSFFQINPVQTKKLYETALEYAALKGTETVWDLYCGIGTISLFLAKAAKEVHGVEVIPQAIEDAKTNASINQIENAYFYVGKAEEVLPEKYEQENISADVIVVDPPRKGCDELCLQTMTKMQPDRIVYVSCDSATLARDLKYLCENGYELKKVRPVDQFCHTVHVETIVALHRTNS